MLPMGRTVLHEEAFPELNTRPSSFGYGDCFLETLPGKYPGLGPQNRPFPPRLSPDLRAKGTESDPSVALLSKGCLLRAERNHFVVKSKGSICSSKLKNSHSACVSHKLLIRELSPTSVSRIYESQATSQQGVLPCRSSTLSKKGDSVHLFLP